MKILQAEQFKQLDQYTIEHEPIRPLDLMERAATVLTEAIASRWSVDTRVFIFAGPGNNGGDGLAVARMLGAKGYEVKVWLFNVAGKISLDCRQNYDRLLQSGGANVVEVRQGFEFPRIRRKDLIVDALFGTGLSKPLEGGFAGVVKSINATHAQVVSIDMPSGLATEDNTYTDLSATIHATLTLTLGQPKLAFLLAENAKAVGEWQRLDIGLSEQGLEELDSPYVLLEDKDFEGMRRPRPAFGHKGTFGHALLVAGSYGMAGAAILAAKAAMRSGLGKLTVHTPAANVVPMQIAVPEAVLALDTNTHVVASTIDTLPYAALGLGPGLGKATETADALNEYIALTDTPMVLDADALNILATHKDWLDRIPHNSILTPHPAEMDRLIGQHTNDYERLVEASAMAKKYQVFIVLKGHHTVICEPEGYCLFSQKGNSGMATAGSGDVLTGLLTGLLAQGYNPMAAALLGVHLHGLAGDLAAKAIGEEAMTASDIIEHLGEAYQHLSF